jgi:uncharacterized membrane protein
LDIYSLTYDLVEGKAIIYAQFLMALIYGIYCLNVHKMYKAIYHDKDTLRWSLFAFALQIPITSNILISFRNDIFIVLFLTLAIRKLIEDQYYQASGWFIAISLFRLEPIIMLSPAILYALYTQYQMKGVRKFILLMLTAQIILGLPFLWTNFQAYIQQILELKFLNELEKVESSITWTFLTDKTYNSSIRFYVCQSFCLIVLMYTYCRDHRHETLSRI